MAACMIRWPTTTRFPWWPNSERPVRASTHSMASLS
jgi:hypothetical protein